MSALDDGERRVVELLHELRGDRAPAGLRARIDAQRPSRAARARSRVVYGGGLVGALAAVLLALVLILPGGTPGAPSVSQAAALATRGSTAPAPPPDPHAPAAKLKMDVQEVYFPNWIGRGWRAVGQRADRIDGRLALTVYYAWEGHRVAYTIVSAPALQQPAASVTTLHNTVLRTLRIGGRWVVTWRRSNHTCVLSVAGVPPAQLASELRQLASLAS
mgnify:CR=1 FL=1